MLSKDNQFRMNKAEIEHIGKENSVLRQQIRQLRQQANEKVQSEDIQQLLEIIRIQRERIDALEKEFCSLEDRYEELLENYSSDLQKARPKPPQQKDETYLEMQIEMETNKQQNLEKLIAELQKKQQQELADLKGQMHQQDKMLFSKQQPEETKFQVSEMPSIGKNAQLNPLKGISSKIRQNSSKRNTRDMKNYS